MFTGIIQTMGKIETILDHGNLKTISISVSDENIKDLKLGSSVCVNGVCLTVVKIENNTMSFDVMSETLTVTTLSQLNTKDFVNIERSMKFGDEVGGHVVSGHVQTKAKIVDTKQDGENTKMTFHLLNEKFIQFLFSKGFVAVNGVSLTLVNVNENDATFEICFIPETLKRTTFGMLKIENEVNVECETQTISIVETVKRSLLRSGLIQK